MKKTLLGSILILTINYASAQKIMQSYGATIQNLVGNQTVRGTTSQVYITQVYGTYFPRYNFVENQKSSISIGLPISLGIALAESDNSTDVGIAFGFDLPVVLDYNFGFKATNEETEGKKLGGFVGCGFGYNKINISKSTSSNFTGVSYGPIFRAGVRFGSSKVESWGNKAIEINFYFKPGLEKEKYTSFGSAVLLNL